MLDSILFVKLRKTNQESSSENTHVFFCEKKLHHWSGFRAHIMTHIRERPFSCHICKKLFATKRGLTIHQLVHTKNKPFSCPEGPAAFGLNEKLQNHVKYVHRKIRPFPCTVCDKAFSSGQKRNIHVLIHVNEFPYKCEICTKRYRYWANLNIHKKVHINGSPYLCSKCLTPVWTQANFESHYLKVHVVCDDNILQCLFCEKVFKTRYKLENHVHTHTQERPHSCNICPTTYTEKK